MEAMRSVSIRTNGWEGRVWLDKACSAWWTSTAAEMKDLLAEGYDKFRRGLNWRQDKTRSAQWIERLPFGSLEYKVVYDCPRHGRDFCLKKTAMLPPRPGIRGRTARRLEQRWENWSWGGSLSKHGEDESEGRV